MVTIVKRPDHDTYDIGECPALNPIGQLKVDADRAATRQEPKIAAISHPHTHAETHRHTDYIAQIEVCLITVTKTLDKNIFQK